MQHDPPQKKPLHPKPNGRLWLTIPLAALGLALMVALVYRVALVARVHFTAKRPSAPASLVGTPNAEAQLNTSLLSDSILSIIQSYYVDPSRVENRGLMAIALAAASTNAQIHTGSSPGVIWVQVDSEDRQLITVKDPPSYQDVVAVVAAISRLLDQHHLQLLTGEVVEKNASGSVMLLNSMLAELDAHSSLLSPDAYRELRQGTEGSFGGLGVLVGIRDNLLTVIKPLPHSPAQRAGIRRFDHILGIGGVFTYGFSLDDLVEHMRGEPGSQVQLTMLRDGALAPVDMKLRREVIHVDSVTAQDINHDGAKILHLTIESFASRTSREVLNAIKKFKLKHGGILNGLILDLRSNPGGLLDQAVQVADLFLDSGVIVTTKGRREEVERAGSGFDEMGYPIVVLIDSDSASASEIVAGALQDQQRAVVVGQPSFGKGSVQTVFELPGERALKLTIARYYSPAGRSIQNVGIIPDVWLQPIGKNSENNHMLGSYRYKNERFLKNHLADDLPGQAGTNTGGDASIWRSYYLRAASDVVQEVEPTAIDREMDAAVKIIDMVHSTYGDHLPAAMQKSNHWLTLAGAALRDIGSILDAEAAAWLKKKHQIVWIPRQNPATPRVKIQLSSVDAHNIVPGETVTLKYTIDNLEAVSLAHASIFVRSEISGFDTKEVLIGELPAGQKQSGSLQITLPGHFEATALPLRVGLALDAWPVPGAVSDFNLNVSERLVAKLSARTELVSEFGGRMVGYLERNEKARVRIDLRNDGDVGAENIEVKMINLAGKQVQVLHDTATIDSLAVGENKHIYLDIKAGKSLVSSELAFGLYVQSSDLKEPLRQRFAISSKPSDVISGQPVKNFSH